MTTHIVLEKNTRERTIVDRGPFKGVDLVSIRVWYLHPDGELRPSKKGIALRAEQVPDLIDALQQLLSHS